MKNILGTAIKLLSLAVIVINFIYLQRGQALNFEQWMHGMMPILGLFIALTFIACLILMVTRTTSAGIKLFLLALMLFVLFPLYHPYLRYYLSFIPISFNF